MTVPNDPYLAGSPLPVETPRDPNARTVIPVSERGEDELRDDIMDTLTNAPAHPLTHDEKDAAENDPGRAPRVFAPAEERVPVEPIPGHAELIEAGLHRPTSPESAQHPGDRSDPREFEEDAIDVRS
jgi:hypothetical protein